MERILNLQRWLNLHGATLVEDGKWGPLTRHAVIETFRNMRAPAARSADIVSLAEQIGVPPRNFRAVARAESGSSGWDKQGLLACLWERHYLWRRVRVAVPLLSNPKPGGYTIDADRDGVCDSWEKLADATGLFGFNIAAECASFGKFQIMGAHWKALGYRSVADFIWQLSRDEVAHYDAFLRFVSVNNLIPALKRVNGNPENCRDFAHGYNGKGYEAGGYHLKIASAWVREG